MDTFITAISAILAGFVGGWAGAYFQFQKVKKSEKTGFLWQIRLKIFEAEQAMWHSNNFFEFITPINWLLVAGDDPRLKIEKKYIEQFIQSLKDGWYYRRHAIELSGDEDSGISTTIAESVEKLRTELDNQVIHKMKLLL
jgi:hypothetical protein